MLALLFAVIFAATTHRADGPLEDTCDVIERNTMLDDFGQSRFEQWIFWSWSHSQSRFRVRAWRVANNGVVERRDGMWRLTFHEPGRNRRIWGASYLRTYTLYDPEVEDRRDNPVRWELRDPLRQPEEP